MMTTRYRKWIYFTLACLALFAAVRTYYNLTDDFRISNIIYPMPERAEWNFPIKPGQIEELKTILNQKFTYLGKGAQVYAFGSDDGKYVIKFFKFKHLKPSPLIALLPSIGPLKEIKEANIKRKIRKLEGVFEGHVNAYNHDLEHSGLLFLHLNPTTNLNLQAHLVDKIGIERTVDLDPIVFILQKKGETLRTVFTEALSKGDTALAAKRATQILDMYVDEYQNGVYDRDHGISHNTGFIGDQPFHLDVGKMSYDVNMRAPENYEQDLRHVARKMDEWVNANYPASYPAFHETLEQHLQKLLPQSPVSPAVPALPEAA
jgi:hypothetical protein